MKKLLMLFFLLFMQNFFGQTCGAACTMIKKVHTKKKKQITIIILTSELCSIIVKNCSYLESKEWQQDLQELQESCDYFLTKLQKKAPEDRFDLIVSFVDTVIQKFDEEFDRRSDAMFCPFDTLNF